MQHTGLGVCRLRHSSWLIGWVFGRLVVWLVGGLAYWLVGWWLVAGGWLACWLCVWFAG